ncbi:MAG: hypothetical protein IPK79_12605 [Vampirovibrionales bacterium]|nr:hypothetical protein [Vampirovibrionales bacterium]
MTTANATPRWASVLFTVAGLYELALGLVFLFAPQAVFSHFNVTPPNHFGYVQFSAALLLIFALMFFEIARAPYPRRDLIGYGILMKAAYCGVAGFYLMKGRLPDMWQPFLIADALFMLGFALALRCCERKACAPNV